MLNTPLNYGIITILLVNFLFLVLKPQYFFTNQNPKPFGTRRGETILPYHSIALLSGIIIYMISLFN